ncbi:MAG TPA: addiction module protein [Tepidisphaeraceae bacterium]|nr:addiction module protein [Tepidisphaeraceae bacterium]
MVADNLLNDLLVLPAPDRLDLIHRLWESLMNDHASLPFSDEQRQELDRRYDEYLSNPDGGSTWEDVEAFVRLHLPWERTSTGV